MRLLLTLALLPLCFGASAQPAYPSKPITVIVPFGPGGVADITARTVGQAMAASLKQPIVIENRPSAGAVVGSAAVAKATPDGYTLLLMSNANPVSAGLFKKLPYDPVKDFAPIGTLGFFDLALFVADRSPLKNVQDLVARAKAQPGQLTIGTIAVGSTQNLAAELFKTSAGIDALVVPYNGTSALRTALMAGQVDVGFEVLGPMMAHLAPGPRGLRALAVTSDRPFAGLPNVPTVQASGVPKYNVASWNALAAPAGTPPRVVETLNAAIREALGKPDVQQRLQSLGVRAQASTPAELGQLLGSEILRWKQAIADAKIPQQ
ncbi:Bug family tripartite tricarboxylate transporter substrate binding protein [Ideonella sp. YS5]|uniref:Bug family tripartite tricarboxylate transporter substrate binding protein n=1 Tax=Ideonella sp. YS5 TaxID=3453714 RepID=UPI003EEE750C